MTYLGCECMSPEQIRPEYNRAVLKYAYQPVKVCEFSVVFMTF